MLRKFYNKSCTAAERAELMEALRQAAPGEPDGHVLDQLLANHAATEGLPGTEAAQLFGRIQQALPPQRRPVRRLWWAAAAAVVALGLGIFFLQQPAPPPPATAKTYDVQPGSSLATLTLSDGSQLQLDSNGRQTLRQGQTAITHQNGELQYNNAPVNAVAVYNTLSTPAGGQFKLVLPDQSAVWLNASSSIRYPTAFTGNNRQVEITGEVYFEVAPDKAKPFIATVNGMAVEVLGTHFNINAYADEASMQTTLLEGRVRITKGGAAKTLQPGEQAVVAGSGVELRVLGAAQQAQIIAWKNGVFNFDQKSLPEVMRQLARWYNVSIVYEGNIPTRVFGGELSRSLPLSEIVEVMREMKVNARIEAGNKLVVTP